MRGGQSLRYIAPLFVLSFAVGFEHAKVHVTFDGVRQNGSQHVRFKRFKLACAAVAPPGGVAGLLGRIRWQMVLADLLLGESHTLEDGNVLWSLVRHVYFQEGVYVVAYSVEDGLAGWVVVTEVQDHRRLASIGLRACHVGGEVVLGGQGDESRARVDRNGVAQ